MAKTEQELVAGLLSRVLAFKPSSSDLPEPTIKKINTSTAKLIKKAPLMASGAPQQQSFIYFHQNGRIYS